MAEVKAEERIKKEQRAIVQYKGEPITITFDDVKNLLCPLATDQEVAIFLKTCQSLNLNPFADQVYLIKYSEKDKAATVISIDAYLAAAEQNDQFDGYESGIILRDSGGKLDFREGAFLLDDERQKLVGGWAKVYRKDRSRPFYIAVNKKECVRYRKDGTLTEFWTEEKQPTMLRKVPLKRALVEAFPSLFSGVISNVDYEVLPAEVKESVPGPKREAPEGELPPAYIKNGGPHWRKFYAKQREKGVAAEEVHSILGIDSLKDDWLEKGHTLEEADEIINDTLEQTKPKTADQAGETERFNIDLTWLKESMSTLKWTDETAKTFLVAKYKVDPRGTLIEVLNQLTREQAEDFTKQINSRLDSISLL